MVLNTHTSAFRSLFKINRHSMAFPFFLIHFSFFLLLLTSVTYSANWSLVWSDEFNGLSINPSNWGYELGYRRNREPQYYTSNIRNAKIENGCLVITALRENITNGTNVFKYTSASLTTFGKKDWLYGRFEMRAKIPVANGVWPAWWALGTNIAHKGWPACGEIDMMEFYSGVSRYNFVDSKESWEGSKSELFSDDTDFHTWAMEWESSTNIRLFLDGALKATYTNGDPCFSKGFYLTINLALGNYPYGAAGNPESLTFPQSLYVDYMRVWQKIPSSQSSPSTISDITNKANTDINRDVMTDSSTASQKIGDVGLFNLANFELKERIYFDNDPVLFKNLPKGTSIELLSFRGNRTGYLLECSKQGGDFFWNGRDVYGKNIDSGAYIARISTSLGETIEKIIIIGRKNE